MTNTKLNDYEIFWQEVCQKFNGTEKYIKEGIEETCNEKKISRRGNLFVYE